MSKINIGRWHVSQDSNLMATQHDTVILSCRMKTGSGKIAAGSLVAADPETATLEILRDDNTDSVFGVITADYDESEGSYTNVLVHGTVQRTQLEKTKGSSLSSKEIVFLVKSGIYPL